MKYLPLVLAFQLGVLLMAFASIADALGVGHRPQWTLDMSFAAAKKLCPTPLLPVFEQYHKDDYYVCDDGKRSTVLLFGEVDKLTGIIDLKQFALTPMLQPTQ